MSLLDSLIETIINESVALTKGSQRVINDKNLVVNLADSIRDDARSHPGAFPSGFSRSCQKTPDIQLAQWFLENIDDIEKTGYEGIVYSRDGVNSDWIVRRYISGSHNWEDLTGVMNMNLCDWYLLKNRNMLDPNHKDLPKFGSVRDVGYYMSTHYKDKLEKLRDASKNAARNKMAKSIKLVDNDDYRIYTTLNRAAGCALGLGTQWCTANSNSSAHYHRYSNAAMLFQLFPYTKEKDKEGKLVNIKDEDGKKELNEIEKYQFDAGGPNFMDVTDRPAKPDAVRDKFPFLFTDLSSALQDKKPQMEKAFAELSIDPTLQAEDFKIKTYEIDEEIKKLHKFVDRGYFTDEVRKKVKPEEIADEVPQLPAASPDLNEEDAEISDNSSGNNKLSSMGASAGPTVGGKYSQGTAPTMPESTKIKGNNIMENVDKDVAAMLTSLKKYDKLNESVLGFATMSMARPKLVAENKEEEQGSEELDEDPVDDFKAKGGQVTKLPYMDAKKEKKEAGKSTASNHIGTVGGKGSAGSVTGKGATVSTKNKTVPAVVGSGKKEMNEATEVADQDVLEWMSRFAKLGNMKGYGR